MVALERFSGNHPEDEKQLVLRNVLLKHLQFGTEIIMNTKDEITFKHPSILRFVQPLQVSLFGLTC